MTWRFSGMIHKSGWGSNRTLEWDWNMFLFSLLFMRDVWIDDMRLLLLRAVILIGTCLT